MNSGRYYIGILNSSGVSRTKRVTKSRHWESFLEEPASGEWTRFLKTSKIDRLARHLLQGYTPKIARVHFYRFLLILRFLRKHTDRLQADGLLDTTSLQNGEISVDLLRALCYTPFTSPAQWGGELFYDFEYALIKKNAEQMQRESSQDG